jgi:hypothetical protein
VIDESSFENKDIPLMKNIKALGWRRVIALLAVLACAASWAAGPMRHMRDRSEVAAMTENMKTVCVGRYLVDVPAQANVSLSHEIIAGFALETIEEGEDAFRKRVAAREAEIAARAPATDALLAQWDSIASSIRLRNNDSPSPAHQPSAAPG